MFYPRSLTYRMLDSFFRHRWIFLASMIAVVILTTAMILLRPKTYTAGYTVLLNTRTLENPLSTTPENPAWSEVDQDVSHLESLVSTQEFMSEAFKNADGTPLILHHPVDILDDDAMANLRKNIQVASAGPDSFTVSISYKDPSDAVAILQGVVRTFINQTAEEKSSYFTEEVAFIGQQVDEYRNKLMASEQALSEFKSKNANNLPSQQDSIESQLTNYQAQSQDLQISIAEDNEKKAYLQKELAQVPKTVIADQTATDSPLIKQLRDMEAERSSDIAVKQMRPTHPDVVALDAGIGRLKQEISTQTKTNSAESKGLETVDTQPNPLYQSLLSELEQVQIDSTALAAKSLSTQALVAKTSSGAALVPQAERELANLTRDYTTYDSNYQTLLSRSQQAVINEQLNLRQERSAYTLLLTSPPQAAQTGKKAVLFIVGGVFLAAVVGIGMLLLSEWLDHSLRDPAEAQRVLGLPVLAVLPETATFSAGEHPDQLLATHGGSGVKVLRG